MPDDDFRRDLRNAFDRIGGAPGSSLSARVRSAVVDAPERRGPVWLAGVAAVALAALVVGALYVVGPLRPHGPTIPGGAGSPTPSAPASPTSNLPAFVCDGSTTTLGSSVVVQTAFINGVRGGTHTGYDRITIEFSNGAPTKAQVIPQANAVFTMGASGQSVQLQGAAGLLVTMRDTDAHTHYTGPNDLHVGAVLLEARQVQDFEGIVQWGLGLSAPACYRAFWLTGPDRLVIDVQT